MSVNEILYVCDKIYKYIFVNPSNPTDITNKNTIEYTAKVSINRIKRIDFGFLKKNDVKDINNSICEKIDEIKDAIMIFCKKNVAETNNGKKQMLDLLALMKKTDIELNTKLAATFTEKKDGKMTLTPAKDNVIKIIKNEFNRKYSGITLNDKTRKVNKNISNKKVNSTITDFKLKLLYYIRDHLIELNDNFKKLDELLNKKTSKQYNESTMPMRDGKDKNKDKNKDIETERQWGLRQDLKKYATTRIHPSFIKWCNILIGIINPKCDTLKYIR
jgi:hypothetical protein